MYAASDIIANQWATISPSLPSLPGFGPISGSLAGLAWPLWGRGVKVTQVCQRQILSYTATQRVVVLFLTGTPLPPHIGPQKALLCFKTHKASLLVLDAADGN